MDETARLMVSPTNAHRLTEAIERADAPATPTLDEMRATIPPHLAWMLPQRDPPSEPEVPEGTPRLVNLTPHVVHLLVKEPDGSTNCIELPPRYPPARCSETRGERFRLSYLNKYALPVNVLQLGDVVGLPDPDPAGMTYYVVSQLVAKARLERTDLLYPDQIVRDIEGNIVGCRGFAQG